MARKKITRREAQEKGLTRFFTGKPCKHGHITERWTASKACCTCHEKIFRAYRKEHSKERSLKSASWRSGNKEHVLEYSRSYEKERSKKRAAERRAVYAANPEPHRERQRVYRSKNPDKKRAMKHARRARQYGADGRHTAKELDSLLKLQKYLCANPYCRADLRKVKRHPDHIVSLSKGGSNYISNMQWLCAPCNCRKVDLMSDEWLKRESLRSRKRKSERGLQK